MESQPLKRRRALEPSQPEVAAWIAEQLDATGEEAHAQILQAVRTVGRTQARALCQKALQMKSEGQNQPAGDLFLTLVRTEGVPKRLPAAPVRSVSVLARSIAEQLQETEEGPIQQITRIVHLLGEEQAQHFLQETLRIEQEGGMMLPNGSRRRTPGGVYFSLVRSSLPNRVRKRVFSAKAQSEGQPQEQLEPQALLKAAAPSTSQTPQPQPLVWNQRLPIIAELDQEKGRASTVKITVVGRPGRVSEQAGCVVTMLQATKFPDLPKGLPIPTNASTRYVLYISMKQWKKVAEAIKDEDDTLIVEGYPHLDAEAKHIAVFASSITTKKLQQALRQTQKVSG